MSSKILLCFSPKWTRACAMLFMVIMVCLSAWSQQQQGKASFYSKRATGARTASGERLHHDSMTCAHKFYPFGTMLKVTNLSNKKSVVVRVTDRGPFAKGRIIDLSWGAAKEIGMLSQGIAPVKVEVVDETTIPMRPKDDIDLPKIDFELAEASYSFIDKWKEASDGQETSPKPKAQARQRTRHSAKARERNQENKKATNQRQTEEKEGQNTWNRVFDKIKNVF